MKKNLIGVLALSAVFSGVTVFADEHRDVVVPFVPEVSYVSVVPEKAELLSTTKLTVLKARGANLIKQRVNSLNETKTIINNSKSLTADQKASLSTILTTNVTGLETLGMGIASSTDATSTKALINSVYTNYRIYGIVLPQVRLEKRIYDLQNHAVRLSETFTKVQVKIDEAKAKGKDVTAWQKALDDAKVLVAADVTKLGTAMTKAQSLKPADYGTSSKATIESVNADIKAVSKDFKTIGKLVRKPLYMKDIAKKITGNATSAPSVFFGTSWTWTSSTVEGKVTSAPEGGKFVLRFGEDKRVSSSTDCNSLMGGYTEGATSLSFGPMASTMMYCEGSKEVDYAQMLAKVTGFKIEGQTLTLSFDKGTMTFVKK